MKRKLTPEEIIEAKKWIKGKSRSICPLNAAGTTTCCTVCAEWFPKIKRRHRDRMAVCCCPCHVYSQEEIESRTKAIIRWSRGPSLLTRIIQGILNRRVSAK